MITGRTSDAIREYGVVKMARELGVKSQAISYWLRAGVPPKWCLRVSEKTGIPPHEIRPDIYPQPEGA